MGEAARRAKNDPTFGRIPKSIKEKKRGLVVSPPWKISNDRSITIKQNWLDPQELRASLLFFDDLVLPQNNLIFLELGIEEKFLREAGVLRLNVVRISESNDLIEATGNIQIKTFQQLDTLQPGVWSLATGENSFNWEHLPPGTHDGFKLELLRAIPVPTEDVPLAEILEFKNKRHDELLNLRAELDNFSQRIIDSESKDTELQSARESIQKSCADLLATSKEANFPIRIADWKMNFELDAVKVIDWAIKGGAIGKQFEMPILGGLIGGAISTFKLTKGFKWQPVAPRSSPYQYVYSFHEELR